MAKADAVNITVPVLAKSATYADRRIEQMAIQELVVFHQAVSTALAAFEAHVADHRVGHADCEGAMLDFEEMLCRWAEVIHAALLRQSPSDSTERRQRGEALIRHALHGGASMAEIAQLAGALAVERTN